MPRRERVIIPNLPHHVTQRGVRKQPVFFSDLDREVYKNLFTQYSSKFGVEVLAYTLMTNHVHHLVVPHEKTSLQWTFQMTHKRYAEYINARSKWTGHLWQARYYSSPVDDDYFWVALRYILRNPVEAGMVKHPADYAWSNARALCEQHVDSVLSYNSHYFKRLQAKSDWMEWLSSPESNALVSILRACTQRDLPTGSTEFLTLLEREYQVVAHPPKIGRPKSGKGVAVTTLERRGSHYFK